jgi:hypothetical protein
MVKRQNFELPTSKQGVQEITLDGGKVRLRKEKRVNPVIGKIIKPCV